MALAAEVKLQPNASFDRYLLEDVKLFKSYRMFQKFQIICWDSRNFESFVRHCPFPRSQMSLLDLHWFDNIHHHRHLDFPTPISMLWAFRVLQWSTHDVAVSFRRFETSSRRSVRLGQDKRTNGCPQKIDQLQLHCWKFQYVNSFKWHFN